MMKKNQLALLESSEHATTLPRVAGRYSNLDPSKLRGGYYTPQSVANWIATWAIRTPYDSVLEPSCGDGSFLEAVVRRFVSLSKHVKDESWHLTGVEIAKEEAAKARTRISAYLTQRPFSAAVVGGDFFSWWSAARQRCVSVAIGNPPFIRYQSFPESSRDRAMQIMRLLGLRPNRLTNIWVPFVAASVASLKPGGRLAMVVPAELLQVSYASQLRSFLADRFRRIDIVACNDLFFDDAEQEVLLLLADELLETPSEKNVCRVAMTEAASVEQLLESGPETLLARSRRKNIRHDSEKWLKYFLSNKEIQLMRHLREASEVTMLSSHASVDVGVVTGKNEFFLLSDEQVRLYDARQYVVPVVARSAHLRGIRFTQSDWKALALSGERVHLLRLTSAHSRSLSAACLRYIQRGEAQGIHRGYKCSIRIPWYAVPSVWNPDGFVFRQIYDFPRFIVNRYDVCSTDTIHRMKCLSKPEQVVKSLYTSLTAASAEIEGRSYGGGVLELEPSEAERILMPTRLGAGMPLEECDRLLRAGQLNTLIRENDKAVLRDGLGLDRSDCQALNAIWMKMRERRASRRRRIVKRGASAG